MKLAAIVLFFVLWGACGGEPEAPVVEPERPAAARLGLWILAEGSHRTLEDRSKVDRLLEDAERLRVTDLFVQVYRSGRSWFPSEHADPAPWKATIDADGSDGLHRLIEGAHARDMRVHAWFNALAMHRNRKAPLLRAVGRDAVLVDRQGRNLLDYPAFDVPQPDRRHVRLGTPGLYLDPATPGVIEYLERTVDDLVAAARDLDGLHLDFIRHPLSLPIVPGSRFDGLDFGYGKPSIARFEAETGQPMKRGQAWDDFRRERVQEMVDRLGARLPEHWERSAAVLPWAVRAYLSAMQDWQRWLEDGSLDFAVAMLYTKDDRLLRYTAHSLAAGVGGKRTWLGLGTWLFVRDPERAVKQVTLARMPSPSGLAYFSYDALALRPKVIEALSR
jgi:uncharacterized lipoprotein YddW (UPF0748 family)